jgi:hypothetical protein
VLARAVQRRFRRYRWQRWARKIRGIDSNIMQALVNDSRHRSMLHVKPDDGQPKAPSVQGTSALLVVAV